ncbi:hypothetical protein [Mycobacterium mantenii]|nr:hypothetical protein [Mycobacterium mantenii]
MAWTIYAGVRDAPPPPAPPIAPPPPMAPPPDPSIGMPGHI